MDTILIASGIGSLVATLVMVVIAALRAVGLAEADALRRSAPPASMHVPSDMSQTELCPR